MRTNVCIVSQLNIFIYSVVKTITQIQKMFQLKFSRYHLYQFHRLEPLNTGLMSFITKNFNWSCFCAFKKAYLKKKLRIDLFILLEGGMVVKS